MKANIKIRDAVIADLVSIQEIYEFHVLNGTGTFEENAPDLAEIERRFVKVTGGNYPYLVAELDGVIIGYAYGGFFRERSAYRFTVEDSVYIAPDYVGMGVGKLLLNNLISQCKDRGFVEMFALIGDSNNHGSISLHTKCGFQQCGIMRNAGYKFNRWLDVVIMELKLN